MLNALKKKKKMQKIISCPHSDNPKKSSNYQIIMVNQIKCSDAKTIKDHDSKVSLSLQDKSCIVLGA
jgi:hypothetical protein